jgi:hypothetical protein
LVFYRSNRRSGPNNYGGTDGYTSDYTSRHTCTRRRRPRPNARRDLVFDTSDNCCASRGPGRGVCFHQATRDTIVGFRGRVTLVHVSDSGGRYKARNAAPSAHACWPTGADPGAPASFTTSTASDAAPDHLPGVASSGPTATSPPPALLPPRSPPVSRSATTPTPVPRAASSPAPTVLHHRFGPCLTRPQLSRRRWAPCRLPPRCPSGLIFVSSTHTG